MNDAKDPLKGYRGLARSRLEQWGMRVWGDVRVRNTAGSIFEGVILPRGETFDDLHIVLKLKTGYNVGIHVDRVTAMEELGYKEAIYKIPEKEFPVREVLPDVTLLELLRLVEKYVRVSLVGIVGEAEELAALADGVVAYEPVWAIGTGKVPTLEQITEVHDFIREKLVSRFGDEGDKIRVLYGGSVKPDNAAEIFATDNVDGALVGGASLRAADFSPIIAALEASA